MNPMVVRRENIDKNTIDRELDIYRTQATNEGKPEKILDRIAAGRLEKFYQEVVLLEQLFIKDSAKTIRDVLLEAGADVKQFVRYQLGEDNA
jgi:elongation factor Ts